PLIFLPYVRRTLLASGVLAVAVAGAACTEDAPPDTPSPPPSTVEAVTVTPPAATPAPAEPTAEVEATPASWRFEMEAFPVPAGARPHDVAPAEDGGVWYTAQRQGALGYLDPTTGETTHIPLGGGSAPHGVIVGPDGHAWVTDGGLNAIVRVDAET